MSVPQPPCEWVADGQQGYGQCWLIIDGERKQVYDGIVLDDGEWQGLVDDYTKDFNELHQKAVDTIQKPLEQFVAIWDDGMEKLSKI